MKLGVMAIYSLNLGFISRSEGRSSVGFSAYIAATHHQDERTGVIYNYSCKSDVIVSRILAPEDAPDWVKNSSILWNKMESLEDEYASLRFRGDPRDPDKNQKSLEAKEQFLASAQPAQTIMGAIPIEFSKEEAEACVEEFLKERFVPRGLVVEYAIHWQKGNPHFHGMITRRALIDGEFSQKKDRDIVSKAEHNITRKMWEVVVNKHLELGGYDVRIDSRSHADRVSLFLPTEHEGWYAQRLAEKGQYSRIVADNDVIRQKNIEILCESPTALIQEVGLKRTTFTRKHLEDEIIRRVGGDEKLFALLKAKVEGVEIPSELILKQANNNMVYEGTVGSKEIFATQLKSLASKLTDQLLENKEVTYEVGENINRNRVFISKTYKDQEEKLIGLADSLHQKQTKVVSEEVMRRAIKTCEKELKFSFSEEQQAAVTHLCSGSDMRLLNGRAGTGKTTLLKAVALAYQEAGYQVLGTSFQGKAVEIMEQEIGIPCRTLDSFDYAWTKHQQQKELVESGRLWGRPYLYAFNRMKEFEKQRLNSNNIILVDEANMIGGHLWELFLEEAAGKGAKILIVQDPAQIKSREPGDYGRLFAERFGFCETREVVRQRIPWQRECSKLLNDHQLLDGLKPYYDKGYFHWFEDSENLHCSLAQDYVKSYLDNPQKIHLALAYRNSEVYAINQSIRQALKDQGYLKECFKIHGEEYAIGDRIRFTWNDNYGHYVKNVHDRPLQQIKKYLKRNLLIEGQDTLLKSQSKQHVSKGVKNGTFGTIESYDEKKSLLTVCLEDKRCLDNKRKVQFNIKDYPYITHGYAMGIHKSEASTFDQSFVAFDPLMDPETFLVALTRHRDDTQVYVNREQFIDFKAIIDKIGQLSVKDTLQDYHITQDQRPYFTRIQQYRDLVVEAVTLREEMEGELKPAQPLYKHPSYSAYQTLFEEKKRVTETILKDWQSHLPYVRLAGIRRDVLEVEAGLRPRLLSDLEHRASIQVQGYMDLVKQTRALWQTISQTHPASLAKSHSLYEDYQSHKEERDSLAVVFQENLKLYTPFLRVTKNENTETNTETYKDYWGDEVTKENRVYITAVKSHAEAHKRSQLQNLYYERLSSEQKAHYDVVKSYVQTRNEATTIYGHLQKQEKEQSSLQVASPGSFLTLEKFHERQAQRDMLALKIIESPEMYQPFFQKLNIREDKLLEHAVAGEFREFVLKYTSAKSIEERLDKAQELLKVIGDKPHKSLFATLKSMDIEISQLRFDQGCLELMKEKGDLPYKTLSELYSAYVSFHTYRKIHQEAAKEWHIIKPHATQKVVSLQDEQIKSLNELKENPELSRDILEEKAIIALQMNHNVQIHMKKVVNTKTLSFISQELARCVRGSLFSHQKNNPSSLAFANSSNQSVTSSSDGLLKNIQSQHNDLMHFQSYLRKGHSGYIGLYKMDHPSDTIWENLREKKLSLALEALKTSGEVIKVAFQNDYCRMEKEAYEHQIGALVSQYQRARGEYKASLASDLISHLEQGGYQGICTKTQLKKSDENFEALYLYGLFHQLHPSLDKPQESLKKLENYINAQETFSALWKHRCEVIDKELGELKEQFNLNREELIVQLEGLSPKGFNSTGFSSERRHSPRSCAGIVDQLIDVAKDLISNVSKLHASISEDETHKVETFKVGPLDEALGRNQKENKEHPSELSLEPNVQEPALANSRGQVLDDTALGSDVRGQALIEKKLQEKIQEHKTSFRWRLTKEDLSILTQEILTLHREKERIHDERLSLMNKRKFENDVEFYSSARDRNEAAFHLIESPFGVAIRSSREALSLEEYAERYKARLKKNEIQSELKASSSPEIHEKCVSENMHPTIEARVLRKGRSFISKEIVLTAAQGHHASIVIDLLGNSNKPMSTKRELRFGNNGSLRVYIAGSKEGQWNNFETGEKGNIIQLIQREKNLNFKEAIFYLADRLNIRPDSQVLSYPKASSQTQKRLIEKNAMEEAKDIASRLNAVSELQMKSNPLEGTLAETYLRQERGIRGHLTPDLRYLSKGTSFVYRGERKIINHHCLATFGRNSEGKLSSVQLTKLSDQGKRALTPEGKKLNKIQYGVATGSFVLLQEGKHTDRILTDHVFIAEGIETALSIKEANVKGKIVASLGIHNVSNYQGPEKEIIICADNDDHKPTSKTCKIIEKAQNSFKSKGHSVAIIKPIHPGDDFNDVLKKEGIKGVQEYVKEYLDLSAQKETQYSIESNISSTSQQAVKIFETKPTDQHETLLKYIDSKLKEIKTYEGTSIAQKAKEDLKTFLKVFEKNEELLEKIKSYSPELAEDIKNKMNIQKLQRNRGLGR